MVFQQLSLFFMELLNVNFEKSVPGTTSRTFLNSKQLFENQSKYVWGCQTAVCS